MSASLSATGKETTKTGGKQSLLDSTKAASTPKVSRVVWTDVRMRPFAIADADSMLDYFFQGIHADLNRQILEFVKFADAASCRSYLVELVTQPALMPIVTIELKGRTIGTHWLDGMVGTQADFQGAFWNSQDRGKGIGTISWFKACEYFFKTYAYDTFRFRVARENTVAIGLAKKLPLNFIGEEAGVAGMVRIFTVTREEFENMSSNEVEDTDDSDI